ncbi:sigma-70 family RNA polymerase sigma factor [Paenibacillus camelliae]|uniref:sigma-70 family RNA polymerase sigma factor n=1 Tax=Paenibacillus camelliae TaxID=512410 RepID=UPI00203E72DC|nr:sigma-70 family RNA polymerase sigma factor [Paenibacillus camelliae]MCM3632870.1 sigma-70 family RNA polymerase sigma factor [Paenibacillus camelliae]
MYDWQAMKESYKATRRTWETKRTELKQLKDQRIADNVYNDELDDDISIIGSIISDLTYVIEWLEHGRKPGPSRGIERRSVYQNTVLVDPHILQNYAKGYESRSSTTITDEQRTEIKSALAKLSPREREVFMLVKGQGFSSEYVANMLGISKGSVDEMIQRAYKKFSQEIQMVLF